MNGTPRRAVDRRLLRYAGAARAHLVLTVALGLVGTGLILAQTGLLARALAVAARGDTAASLSGTLAVLGTRGLAVADSSVMPVIPRANTNLASMMIGHRAADVITS